MDTLYKSIEAIEHSNHLGTVDYTRDNIKQTIHISDSRKQQAVNTQTSIYKNLFYGKGYHYNTKMRQYFEIIKKENPNTKFIIFTTPISADLFKILVQSGNLPDYKKWLTMLVDVFGEVYDYMGINTITSNPSNYADLHHFYPEFGTLIVDRITGVKNSALPKDFGVLVNKKNLKAHFDNIDKQVESLQDK
jgi:hypothetical protein